MKDRSVYVFLALLFGLCLALLAVATVADVRAQSHPVVSSQLTMGRYQVVNPTPEFIRNTMLIDTATGRTWAACDDKQLPGWCPMFWKRD
jgi:hypothetical protein